MKLLLPIALPPSSSYLKLGCNKVIRIHQNVGFKKLYHVTHKKRDTLIVITNDLNISPYLCGVSYYMTKILLNSNLTISLTGNVACYVLSLCLRLAFFQFPHFIQGIRYASQHDYSGNSNRILLRCIPNVDHSRGEIIILF